MESCRTIETSTKHERKSPSSLVVSLWALSLRITGSIPLRDSSFVMTISKAEERRGWGDDDGDDEDDEDDDGEERMRMTRRRRKRRT